MANGKWEGHREDSGSCFLYGRRKRIQGSKAPIAQEGNFRLSKATAALAQLKDGAYLTVFGDDELRDWIEEAEAEVGVMRGRISFPSKDRALS